MSITIDVTSSIKEGSMELNIDNDKKISSDNVIQIVCSPDIKYVATLNEREEIGIWKVEEHIIVRNSTLSFGEIELISKKKPLSDNDDNDDDDDDDELEDDENVTKFDKIDNISLDCLTIEESASFEFEKMCGISDEGLLNLLYKGKSKNVKERAIFDIDKDRRPLATFKSHVTDLKFLKNGYLVVTEMSDNEKFAPFIEIKVFSIRKTQKRTHLEFKHSMSIHPTTVYSSIDSKNFLSDGKFLFGFDLVQQWNIVNATFENNFHQNFAHICLTNDEILSKYHEENFILMHLKKPNLHPLTFSPFYRLHNVNEILVSKNFDFLNIREIREDNTKLEFNGYYFVDLYEARFGNILMPEKVISMVDNKPLMRNLVCKEVMQQQINQFMSTHFLLSNNLPFINEIKGEKLIYGEFSGEFSGESITWRINKDEENVVTLSAIGDQDNLIDTLILDKFLKIFNNNDNDNDTDFNESIDDSYIQSYLLPNGDLIIVTKNSLMFITATDKIQILYYFSRNQFFLDGEMLFIDIDSNFKVERFEYFLNNLDKNFGGRHPYKDMIMIYLDNIITFNLYAANILAAAIITHRGDYIELIIDKCLEYYKINPDQINIFKVITASLPKLKRSYPYYINKFLILTALIKAPHINKIYESKHSHLCGYTHETHLFTLNIFSRFYFNTLHYILLYTLHYFKLLSKSLSKSKLDTTPTIDLYIPLPGFASYSVTYNFFEEFFWKAEPNGFVQTIIPELYSDWAGEALINFKWKTFGRIYYIGIWILYTFFFVTFTLATTEFDGFLTSKERKFLLKICVLLGIIQLYFEIRKFIWNPGKYITNFTVMIDLCTYIFPIYTSILLLTNDYESSAIWQRVISVLVLDIKFIFFLRSFSYFGVFFEIISNVAKSVLSFSIILIFIIFAYAHAFYILLQPAKPFDPDNPDFDDDPNSPWNLATTYKTMLPDGNISSTPTLIETPSSSTNLFDSFGTSILAVFALMTGDYSSLSGWEMRDNATLSFLWITFLFVTGIYLLNMFIGLLNLGILNKDNYALFLTKKARLIADIELFYLLPNQRRWRHWFPDHIYYHTNVEEVQAKLLELNEINLNPDRQYKLYKPIIHHNLLKLINMDKNSGKKMLTTEVTKSDAWTQTD
ncbi:hypothetical protein Glove_21g125 [Diversispora epigaea]|uniref:Ion transport domain-containing protein n=1 Tax=Diversispora epigaea TaxID=1348612 RepID=A0A397JJY0_9GLOM|nr:hypothetical protein Glove_21g125 [Diversispora epigaea]